MRVAVCVPQEGPREPGPPRPPPPRSPKTSPPYVRLLACTRQRAGELPISKEIIIIISPASCLFFLITSFFFYIIYKIKCAHRQCHVCTNTKTPFILTLLFFCRCYSDPLQVLVRNSTRSLHSALICHASTIAKAAKPRGHSRPSVNESQPNVCNSQCFQNSGYFLPEIVNFPVYGTCLEQLHFCRQQAHKLWS